MDRLVFTANTAMSEYRLDRQNMTHELANVSTTGFKKAFQVANQPVRTQGSFSKPWPMQQRRDTGGVFAKKIMQRPRDTSTVFCKPWRQ